MHKNKSWLIIPIVVIGFFLRLYKITDPLADWHSWRQADTASVAREYVKHGIDFLHPRYMDVSDIPSGSDNPQGYRMVEFPLIPAFVAFLYQRVSPLLKLEIHVLYRLVNIFLSLGSTYLMYRLVKLLDDEKTALIAALVFAILPYNLFYSRAVLPEIALVMFSLLAVFLGVQNLYDKSFHVLHSMVFVISAATALLLKPTAIFFFAPVAGLYLWALIRKEISLKKLIWLLALGLLSLVPLLGWRLWIAQYPEGIPAVGPLINAGNIRFKGAWWHWLFAERLGNLILGYWGMIPFGLGLLSLGTRNLQREARSGPIFYALFLISCFLYLAVFASGNVRHDYYQIILIPLISILIARGSMVVMSLSHLNRAYSSVFLVSCFLFLASFSWYTVRGYFNVNNWNMVKAGKVVDQVTEADALIIAPYGGDTAFLYQTNRRGWPVGGNIEAKIKMGADYYVTTTFDDEARELAEKYQVLENNSEFTLVKLTPKDSTLDPQM